jgi:hypothetical protein
MAIDKPSPCPLPDGALLGRYIQNGHYADCYSVDIPESVSSAKFVTAFYTTWVFKLERLFLQLLVAKPSTDVEAEKVALGRSDFFAAWSVESRAENQLLMCDFLRRTRSWFMVVPVRVNGAPGTRLYFGSAVVPSKDRRTGRPTLGIGFRAMLGFHKLYSKVLLSAAKSRLVVWSKP